MNNEQRVTCLDCKSPHPYRVGICLYAKGVALVPYRAPGDIRVGDIVHAPTRFGGGAVGRVSRVFRLEDRLYRFPYEVGGLLFKPSEVRRLA